MAQWTPLGAMWSMPGQAALEHTGSRAASSCAIAAGFLVVLWIAWLIVVRTLLTRPQREAVPKVYVGLG